MKNIIIINIILILFSCKIDKNPISNQHQEYAFAIYFLKDNSLTIKDIMNNNYYPFITNLQDLELEDNPWISDADIRFYEWSSHCIYLNKDKSLFFPGQFQLNYGFPKSWTDKPWILVINGIACYAGYIATDLSLDIFPFPEINALTVGCCPADILASDWQWGFVPDIRNSEIVKEALIQKGLFHHGLEVSIDTTDSPIIVLNDTTAWYNLRFTNNDEDNIYVFDPYKIDLEIFHFYNNGLNFLNVNSGATYSIKHRETRKPDGWPDEFDKNWYTLIKSGESIKRAIELKYYTSMIPKGTYWIQTVCGTPRHALEKNIRETPLGRYYVACGEVHSNPIRIEITY